MDKKPPFKSGMVSIIGRPNVGKSTLLNAIIDTKVAIVSKIPQTTRNQIRGIYNDERGQIVFIDTPGIHYGRDNLDRYMNESSSITIHDADCIIYLVDLSRRIGEEEHLVAGKLKDVKAHVVMGLNKMDLGQNRIPEYIELWEQTKGKPVTEMKDFTLLPVSGFKDVNVDTLIDILFAILPEGPAYYPADTFMDVPQKMAMADIIREKLFLSLKQELPHSVGVFIEGLSTKRNTTNIKALVYVEKNTHKEIVIGKGGAMMKRIGTQAREELEKMVDGKVFLELRVKTQANWRDDISILTDLGYRL